MTPSGIYWLPPMLPWSRCYPAYLPLACQLISSLSRSPLQVSEKSLLHTEQEEMVTVICYLLCSMLKLQKIRFVSNHPLYLSVSYFYFIFRAAALFSSLFTTKNVGDLSIISTAGATPTYRLQWKLSISFCARFLSSTRNLSAIISRLPSFFSKPLATWRSFA